MTSIYVDHKTRTQNCPGVMIEPIENYGKWAYWYGNGDHTGWHSKPNPKPTTSFETLANENRYRRYDFRLTR